MYQNKNNCRQYRSKPNTYQQQEYAPRRNPSHQYQYQFREHQKYYANNYHNQYHQELNAYSDNHNSSNCRKKISSIYIPMHNKSETYDENGHIMSLSYDPTHHYFDLFQFIRTITNRDGTHYIQRSKLLKVDKLQNRSFQLKITVSSPHIFQKLFRIENQPIIRINNINFKYEIPQIYHAQSYCTSLKLCIKQFSANQDVAVWSSSCEEWGHPISYYIENRVHISDNKNSNKLLIYLGDCDGTEYKLSVNPKDVYYVEYRNDGYNEYKLNKECHLKLRLYRPCAISKLPIATQDHCNPLIFPNNNNNNNSWINLNGKIFKQCGNPHIYNNNNNEIHMEHKNSIRFSDYETSLKMLPKLIGKSLVLFLAFDSEPIELLQWIDDNKPTQYDYLRISHRLVSPPNMTRKNEYRDNLLNMRGGSIIDEALIDCVDCLINGARIADEYVMHEQELTSIFFQILGNTKYMTRFVHRNKENKDQALVRYALQYYGCHCVKYLKKKMFNAFTRDIYKSDAILRFLIEDTKSRICNNNGDLLITAPFSNHNCIEIKRVLVTPTRCVMCPAEHWPLSNVFGWILDKKYMDHLLFVSFVTEDFEAMSCFMLNASNGSEFGFILKNYLLSGMNDGCIVICNRSYQYLFSTPQLFRHRTLCFFQCAKYVDGKHVGCMQLMNRVCRAALTTNGIMAHWATKRFLPSITIIPSGDIGKYQEMKQNDLYTDGQGLMPCSFMHNILYRKLRQENSKKLSLYRLNIDEYKDDIYPTLIRFAYKGYFGVLTLNPFDKNEKQFIFRKSQQKYRYMNTDVMEIYEFSYWKPPYLTPNAIFVLQSLGINVQIIYDLVCNRLKLLNHARCNDECAQYLLSNLDCLDLPAIKNDKDGYSFTQNVWIKALKCKLLENSEVFFTKFIQVIIENEVGVLRSEYKVMMDYKDGALLYGCIDELQILNKNEVFIQTYNKELDSERWDIWGQKGEKVLIYNENHIYYPSDVISMQCVYSKELQGIYRNVVVFPHPSKCDGDIPIFFQCGGATLNGETQFICIRNQHLIPNKKYNVNREYIEYPLMETDHKMSNDEFVSEHNMREYAYNTIANDNIDVDTWKLVWLCYADRKGAKCIECKQISKEIYKANKYHLLHIKLADIEQYKCGLLFPSWLIKQKHALFKNMQINNETESVMKHIADIIERKYVKYKLSSRTLGYDVILMKETNNIFRRYRRNGSALCDVELMNELCERMGDDDVDKDGNNWKHIFAESSFGNEILSLKRAFDFDLFLRCKQYGVIHECELLSAKLLDLSTKQMSSMDWNEYQLLLLKRKQFLCGRDESYCTKTVLSKMMHDMMYHYREKLINGVNANSDGLYAKSMYIYQLIYKENFEILNSKQNYPFPSLLFAWILADYWLQIKLYIKDNHPNVDRVYLKNNFILQQQCDFTPGFIGNTLKDKEEIWTENEKQIAAKDCNCNTFGPVPHFVDGNDVSDKEYYDGDDDGGGADNNNNVSINNYDDAEKYYKQLMITNYDDYYPQNENEKDLRSLRYKQTTKITKCNNEYYQDDKYLNTAMHHHRNRNNNQQKSELHYVTPK